MDLNKLITQTIILDKGNPETKKAEIRNYFLKTWEIDELLYNQLKSDDIFYHRGDPLRHVILFYLGHTAVFFINKMILAGLIKERVNPDFESIFAIGVDEMSWDDLDEKNYNWPSVKAVREYRDKVKKIVLDFIDKTPLVFPVDWKNPFWIIMMGIEHERIHLETSSVLIRQLPLNEVVAGRFGEICKDRGEAPINNLVTVPAAKVNLGKPENHPLYGWDNEYGTYSEDVKEYKASEMLISNGEFLAFVEDGGYKHKNYWTEEGWNWCQFKEAEMPLFWRKKADGYWLRLVAEEISMPWNWPVEVNYLEAKAFCNWKTVKTGKTFRLPTEAEWYRLAEHCKVQNQPEWDKAPGNINLEYFASPCPVNMFKFGDFYDVLGNVWQWTETPITGFPGFKVHLMYDDFSTPTFDGKHNLIKGGSWISTGNEATLHSRYAFRRHFYQHAGFRLVQSEEPLVIQDETYETDLEVANSCENMWGQTTQSNFHQQFAKAIRENITGLEQMNVLDLNTDTGRLAFELAPFVKQLMALDFSARFIRIPIRLQERGFMRYIVRDENDLVFYREVVLKDTGLTEGLSKIKFMQDNANNLKPIHSNYDLIIAPFVLEELNCPNKFLSEIHTRVNDGGYLVIASDYNWDRNKIQHDCRPGGFKKDGEPVTSLDGINAILSKNFELQSSPVNLSKYEWLNSRQQLQSVCEISIWKKK
ncbi:MAG: SAM-dependent methyltransferase [Bacteroidales bacterium 36-12]|nr:MAG: SAM-dependent methyltransferase [Bacteroidales bacterium 36-12]